MALSQATLELLVQLKDEASKGLESVRGGLSSLATSGIDLAAKGFGILGSAIGDGIADARDAAQIFAQTQQVIQSTGGAAGFSADQIANMASSLSAASGKSLFGDDDIERGQNMLLTFTNIKETLPDTTKTMLDIAQAMHTDAGGAAIQLGKALNDPIKGIAALSRIGVTFTDEQKAQIKAMQDAGDMAGAQRVILAELNKEFGGSAEAAAKADGGMAQWADRVGEAKEAIGTALLPVLGILGGILNDVVAPAIESAVGTFVSFIGNVQNIISAFQDAGAGSSAFADALGAIFGPELGKTISDLVAVLQVAIPAAIQTASDIMNNTLLPAANTIWGFISANLQPILVGLATALVLIVVPAFIAWATAAGAAAIATIAALAPVLIPIALISAAVALLYAAWQSNFMGIQTTVMTIWAAVQPVFAAIVSWLAGTIAAAVQTLSALWTGTLQPALAVVWGFIQGSVIPILGVLANVYIALVKAEIQALASFWTNVLHPALNLVWGFISGSVIPILGTLANVAIAVVKVEVQALANLWNNTLKPALDIIVSVVNTLISVLSTLANDALAGAQRASESISSFWNNTLKPAFDTIAGVVSGTLSSAFSTLKGILDGISGAFDAISRAISGAIRWIHDLIDAIGGIHIPDILRGHSPPPLANHFDDIASAIRRANEQLVTFANLNSVTTQPILATLPSVSVAGPGAQNQLNATIRVVIDDRGASWLKNVIRVESDRSTQAVGRQLDIAYRMRG
jgi:hypothetical protein